MISEEMWNEIAVEMEMDRADLDAYVCKIDAAASEKGIAPHWRDRDGDLISLGVWSVLFGSQAYRYLKCTTLASGIWVATIWTGESPRCLPFHTPFETSVFPNAPTSSESLKPPYAQKEDETEAAALATHAEFVEVWSWLDPT